MTQKQTPAPRKHEEPEESAGKQPETTIDTASIDDVLDDIDEVLEGHTDAEAEDFVRSYVQKGGQ